MIPEANTTAWSLTAPWVAPDTGPLDMAVTRSAARARLDD